MSEEANRRRAAGHLGEDQMKLLRLFLVFLPYGTGCVPDGAPGGVIRAPGSEVGLPGQGEQVAQPPADGAAGSPPTSRAEAIAKEYPDLFALYAGDRGLYRGCGPNGGVCHNGREYPNLAGLGAIMESINLPCNQRRESPAETHNLCERPGDHLRVGDREAELVFIEPAGGAGGEDPRLAQRWRLAAAGELASALETDELEVLELVRGSGRDALILFDLFDYEVEVEADPSDPSGRTLLLTLPDRLPPPPPGEESEDPSAFLAERLAAAGVPGDPQSIQVADPNRDGVRGASLGGRLIKPGDPAKSYLLSRLVDPGAGPLMPRANCCAFSKASLRALYCWIAGLNAEGTNALEPIDYAACPDGPEEQVLYPEPGPSCETSGLCPVRIALPEDSAPSWPNVSRIFEARCTSGGCHAGSRPAANLDLATRDAAERDLALRGLVVPGSPETSSLVIRLDPELCRAPACALMPKDGPPLEPEARRMVTEWIRSGATFGP